MKLSKGLLLIAIASLGNLKSNANIFDIKRSSTEHSTWLLWGPNGNIAELQSIGGVPSILSLHQIEKAPHGRLALVEYSAGSTGTYVITRLDRLAVLHHNLSSKTDDWKLVLDIPLSIKRLHGEKTLYYEKRKLKWSKDYQTLKASSFDGQTSQRFEWDQDTLKDRSTETTQQ